MSMRHAFLLLPSSFILFLSACAPAQSLAPLAAPSPTSFALYISDAQATLAAARGQATEAARAAVQATEIAAQKTAAWDEQQNAYAFSARQTQDAILVARQACARAPFWAPGPGSGRARPTRCRA